MDFILQKIKKLELSYLKKIKTLFKDSNSIVKELDTL